MAFIDKSYDLDNMSLSINVGEEGDVQELEFDLKDLTQEIRDNLTCHGASQKLGDSAASVKAKLAKDLNREPTPAELKAAVIAAIQGVWGQLTAGEWRAARGEGEAKPRVGEVAQAIARLQNIPVEQAAALVSQVSKEKLATWRAHPQMKLAIAQIRQERAAQKLAAEMAKVGDAANFNPNA